MSAPLRLWRLFLCVIIFNLLSVPAIMGEKKDEKLGAKESIALGLNMMHDLKQTPEAMKDLIDLLKDPSAKAEVQALMSDPAFKREMEKLMDNPTYMNAIQGAKQMFNDPEKVARLHSDIVEQAQAINGDNTLTDAELGMRELSKANKDPKALAEALEMLKDPEIAAEVQAMMKDPSFQAEMKRYTESRTFKAAMTKATEEVEKLSNDPVRLKKFEADFLKA